MRAIGCFFVFISVALGAFGAHAMNLQGAERHYFDLASHYLAFHGLALLVLSERLKHSRLLGVLAAGSLIFSGSLYLLAIGLPHWLGMITPIGGTLLLIGWFAAGVRFVRESVEK